MRTPQRMTAAAEHIVAGEVTQAVRDANSDAGPVTTGDFIGIGPDGISAVAGDVVTATTNLLDRCSPMNTNSSR